jgi:TetR/AcrR family transcriptional repressor of nem operon
MGRPRSFDTDVVLDKAVEAFRSKGYAATSVEDLERVTGLRRASLYGAFHDKHSLYLAALKRYDTTNVERVLSELKAAPSGRRAIEGFFRRVVGHCLSDPNGCLMANAAMERGNSDARAADCIVDNRRRMEGALRAAIARGHRDGSLKGGADVPALARYLFSVTLGLRGLAKSGCTGGQLREVAEQALKAL